MRILMLSDFYPPVIGGMERHVHLLCEGLSKRGHAVTVFTVKTDQLSSFEGQSSIKKVMVDGLFEKIPFLFKDAKKKYHPPVTDWLITNKLRDVIEETKPDVIHTHGWVLYSLLPLKKRYDVPLIATLHDYCFLCPKKSFVKNNEICNKPYTIDCVSCGLDQYSFLKSLFAYWGNKFNRNLLNRVDKFIAVSQHIKETYLAYSGLDEEKMIVIPNFYEVEEDFHSRENVMLPEEFILFVGALIPSKGVDLLMAAYNTIETKTNLVLIGTEHPDYSYESSGNVIVMKNVPHEAVMKACAACKFLVIPGVLPEACPTVAMEAMHFKKAVVASDTGGLKELVTNGITGILTSPGNTEELANAICFLLGNPEKARKMGEKGYDLATNSFSLDAVLPRIEGLYEVVS